jgi:hypothetical protein
MSVPDPLFQAGKYPYALFIAHLAIEKLLKGNKKTCTSYPFFAIVG